MTAHATPGHPIVRGPFTFHYNTAGLANGVAFYTPTVGDILCEAWIEVDTAFNGTTPRADIGQFTSLVSTSYGMFGWTSQIGPGINLAIADTIDTGGGPLMGSAPTSGGGVVHNLPLSQAYDTHQRRAPIRFITDDPLLLVVSQDATKGGAAVVDATQGAGRLYIITATPTSF